MKLTKNFNLNEFNCNDGTVVPDKYLDNVTKLADNLQVIRNYINEPLHINSSYRTESYNKAIGGVKNSQHLTASAADITAKGYTSYQLHKTIEHLIKIGRLQDGGLGLYNGFVHFDIRNNPARWDQTN